MVPSVTLYGSGSSNQRPPAGPKQWWWLVVGVLPTVMKCWQQNNAAKFNWNLINDYKISDKSKNLEKRRSCGRCSLVGGHGEKTCHRPKWLRKIQSHWAVATTYHIGHSTSFQLWCLITMTQEINSPKPDRCYSHCHTFSGRVSYAVGGTAAAPSLSFVPPAFLISHQVWWLYQICWPQLTMPDAANAKITYGNAFWRPSGHFCPLTGGGSDEPPPPQKPPTFLEKLHPCTHFKLCHDA